jgi:hypothetical protein
VSSSELDLPTVGAVLNILPDTRMNQGVNQDLPDMEGVEPERPQSEADASNQDSTSISGTGTGVTPSVVDGNIPASNKSIMGEKHSGSTTASTRSQSTENGGLISASEQQDSPPSSSGSKYGLAFGVPIAALILIVSCYIGYKYYGQEQPLNPKETVAFTRKKSIANDDLLYIQTVGNLSRTAQDIPLSSEPPELADSFCQRVVQQPNTTSTLHFGKEPQPRSPSAVSLINVDGSLRESKLLPITPSPISPRESSVFDFYANRD